MLETDILTFTEYACSLGIILEICVAYVKPLVYSALRNTKDLLCVGAMLYK
jgi:hypothetical protein